MELTELATSAARWLSPEAAHTLTIKVLKTGMGVPRTFPPLDARHAVTLPVSGLTLANPIGLAAGFDKNAEVHAQMLAFGFGFVECGTVTPRPQAGNPRPRLFRLSEDKAVINRMGFNNEGLVPFVERLANRDPAKGLVGANVGANKDSDDRVADYIAGMEAVWPYADYITLNISSPNTPGLRGLQDKGALETLLGRCGEAAAALHVGYGRRPVFLKVAPDIDETAIAEIASVARAAPYLHGLIVSNTTLARPDSLVSKDRLETGGLSGAPLMALSTEILAAFKAEIGDALDLIGAGGISTPEDVHAKMAAGAQAVQLYSALVYEGPTLVGKLVDGLTDMA